MENCKYGIVISGFKIRFYVQFCITAYLETSNLGKQKLKNCQKIETFKSNIFQFEGPFRLLVDLTRIGPK